MKFKANKIHTLKVVDTTALSDVNLMSLHDGVFSLDYRLFINMRSLGIRMGIDGYEALLFIYHKEYLPKRGFYDFASEGIDLLNLKLRWYSFLAGKTTEDLKILIKLVRSHNLFTGNSFPAYLHPTVENYEFILQNYLETVDKASSMGVFSDLGAALMLEKWSMEPFFRNLINLIYWAHYPAGNYENWDGSENFFNVLSQIVSGLMDPERAHIGVNLFSRMAESISGNTETGDWEDPDNE